MVTSPARRMPLPFAQGPREARTVTFMVGGQAFELPRPFLAIHSPEWAKRLAEEPQMPPVELEGEADSFGAFVAFLTGADGDAGEVTAENVLPLLHWGRELGVDYISGQCEAFLLTGHASGLEPVELLEVASRYDLPLIYARATEAVAQGMHHVKVPEDGSQESVPEIFRSTEIREDTVRTHLAMGTLVHDVEQQKRHRFADHTRLRDPEQKARVIWKTRRRQQPAPEPPKDPDWRCTQAVWPHHSMYGEEWTVVPAETQPNRFRSFGGFARSADFYAGTGDGADSGLHTSTRTATEGEAASVAD
uniref:BTB domain-containing protein n=1 Tax=Alexandrium monilatum TaxID=311494 RepID=A0A7S4QF99_9DINO